MNPAARSPRLMFCLFCLFIGLLPAISCQDHQLTTPPNAVSPDMVLAWDQFSTVAVTRETNPAIGYFILPHIESRLYAMINLAMYDALNTIQKKHAPYTLQSTLVPDASPDAAVSAAAHDVLVSQLPTQKAYADSVYTAVLAKITNGDAKTKGISLGQLAAKAIIAKRTGDGSETAQIPFPIGTNPGDYQYTPPFDGPPFNGYYALAGWKDVKPFALTSGSQFRPHCPTGCHVGRIHD